MGLRHVHGLGSGKNVAAMLHVVGYRHALLEGHRLHCTTGEYQSDPCNNESFIEPPVGRTLIQPYTVQTTG